MGIQGRGITAQGREGDMNGSRAVRCHPGEVTMESAGWIHPQEREDFWRFNLECFRGLLTKAEKHKRFMDLAEKWGCGPFAGTVERSNMQPHNDLWDRMKTELIELEQRWRMMEAAGDGQHSEG